jgi:hypothetical protein
MAIDWTRTTRTLLALGGTAAGAAAYRMLVRPRLRRWGSHAGEVRRALPGDDLVSNPQIVTTRAVTIEAPPASVWPWVVQMGQKRGGFYSYDGLERLAGLDIRNADRIHPEWQDVAVGETIYLSPSSAMIVTELEPERTMVLYQEATVGGGFDETMRWSWAFALEPIGPSHTRFLVRTRVNWLPTGLLSTLLNPPVELVHFIMERGMLHGLKRRAETEQAAKVTKQ